MSDCPNAEMRDRLPELVHERLEASERTLVLAHLERCADCRAELALLRDARRALDAASRVNSARIARAVVARTVRAPSAVPIASRRPRWMDWRIAATIAVLAAGGASLITLRGAHVLPGVDTIAANPSLASGTTSAMPGAGSTAVGATTVVADGGNTASASEGRAARPTRELSITSGVSDLSDAQLQALLDEMEMVDALPSTDPDPVMVHVTPSRNEGSGE